MLRIQKTISEFLGEAPHGTIAPGATVADAVATMRSGDLSCVLVMEEGSLLGIFTERDLLTRVVGSDRAFDEIPIAEVMTPRPTTLAPEAGIAYAIHEMAVGGFRNLPIVGSNEVKLLTVSDVIRHLAEIFDEFGTSSNEVDGDDSWIDIGGQG